jgi:hypothetical protein
MSERGSSETAKVDFRVAYQPWPAGKEFPLRVRREINESNG